MTATPLPWPQAPVSGRVLVIVPSRDRPKQLANLCHSVFNTSERADVHAYIDRDQADLYQWTKTPPTRLRVTSGPRMGPVASANKLAMESASSYVAFGFVPDDALFTTPGWDELVLRTVYGGARAVAPAHGTDDVDMPFVSDVWLERLGWLAWPGLYHWGWPSVVAALGDAAGHLYRAKPPEFWIDHAGVNSKNRDRYPADIVALYDFFASHFKASLDALRGAPRAA